MYIAILCNLKLSEIPVPNYSEAFPSKESWVTSLLKRSINIQYVPVQTKSFEDVEIVLRNDTGDPVPFERGKLIATLHFRQRSYFT